MEETHYLWIQSEKPTDHTICECNTIGMAPLPICPWDVGKNISPDCKGKGYIGGPIFKEFHQTTACDARKRRWILGYTRIGEKWEKDFIMLHTGDINFPDMRIEHFMRIKDLKEAIGCTCSEI